ncbi:MAG: sulfatase-like hydrolase/transferase [Actinomycetota bacterium]
MTKSLLALLLVVGLLAAALAKCSTTATGASGPNIIFVLTDDQAYRGTVAKMPWLHSHQRSFTRFKHAYVNNALCCPSRATILSGLYSHHTHVEVSHDGPKFDASQTIATWLHDAGYRTGLFGKYLNFYPFSRGPFKPAGWDVFSAFKPEGYFDYSLRTPDGDWSHYGFKAKDYSTRVLGSEAQQFVRESPTPFFAYIAPFGPHRNPGSRFAAPDPRDRYRFQHANVHLPPNFNRIAKHAPRYWRHRDPLGRHAVTLAVRRAWATVLSEDRMLKRLYRTLKERGVLANTVIVFSSDNGYSFGSHRQLAKQCGYEECGHVPFLIRAPGVPPRTVRAVVGNQDIAPTLAALAGVPHPPTDGSSLVPLMRGQKSSLHRPMLLRNKRVSHDKPPSFWGLRTKRWKFVKQTNGERELYNLHHDRGELRNIVAERPEVARRLGRKLARIRHTPP